MRLLQLLQGAVVMDAADPYEDALLRLLALRLTRPDRAATVDRTPSAVIADVRAIGEQERRDIARGAARERAGWVAAIGVCQAFAVFGGLASRIAKLTDDLRDARVYLQREREWTGSHDVSQADVRAIIEAVPEALKVAACRLANAARLRHEEKCGVVLANLVETRTERDRLRQELAALRGAK